MLDSQISLTPQFNLAPQAQTFSKSSTRDASRILCLKLQERPSTYGVQTLDSTLARTSSGTSARPSLARPWKRTPQAIAESFLKFTPRLVFRLSGTAAAAGSAEHAALMFGAGTESTTVLWLFLDIASTSHLFLGEEECAREACALAQALGFGVQYSVSDTPSGAQAFIASHPNTVCPPGEERERLKKLSLPLLLHLEGVQAWARPSQVETMITFFMMLGFKTVGDLERLSEASFRERWGAIGVVLWQRLNALDRAVISPLVPVEPLEDYVHLDFPISLVSLLLRHSEKSLDYLFARLQGRRLFASRLVFTFFCEYSGASHKVVIEPNTPSRNQELFTILLENKLGDLNLENPIRDFEVALITCEERASQLDFFEPRVTHKDRLETLFSVLLQSSVKPGLFELRDAVMPEESWHLIPEPRVPVRPEDVTLRRRERLMKQASGDGVVFAGASSGSFGGVPVGRAVNGSPTARASMGAAGSGGSAGSSGVSGAGSTASGAGSLSTMVAERSVAYTPAYGDTVQMAPRPSRLLNEPIPLAIEELERLKILSSTPIERLENGWWEDEVPKLAQRRDYYFAVSPEGQCLWIYQDLTTDEYFLHGYFD